MLPNKIFYNILYIELTILSKKNIFKSVNDSRTTKQQLETWSKLAIKNIYSSIFYFIHEKWMKVWNHPKSRFDYMYCNYQHKVFFNSEASSDFMNDQSLRALKLLFWSTNAHAYIRIHASLFLIWNGKKSRMRSVDKLFPIWYWKNTHAPQNSHQMEVVFQFQV